MPFLDLDSTATFCTEKWMNELNIQGQRTEVLLKAMGAGETCKQLQSVQDDTFLKLPEVYTHSEVTKENIPTQDDVMEWPYLIEVQLTMSVDKKVGLLIGQNCSLDRIAQKLWNHGRL